MSSHAYARRTRALTEKAMIRIKMKPRRLQLQAALEGAIRLGLARGGGAKYNQARCGHAHTRAPLGAAVLLQAGRIAGGLATGKSLWNADRPAA